MDVSSQHLIFPNHMYSRLMPEVCLARACYQATMRLASGYDRSLKETTSEKGLLLLIVKYRVVPNRPAPVWPLGPSVSSVIRPQSHQSTPGCNTGWDAATKPFRPGPSRKQSPPPLNACTTRINRPRAENEALM